MAKQKVFEARVRGQWGGWDDARTHGPAADA